MRLEGRTALVTGGGSGIGEAIVARLAAEGASVHVGDINLESAERVAAEAGAEAVALDVTDPDAAQAAVEAIGTLDVLVNNAGTDEFAFFTDTDPALWDRLIALNLVGVLACTHAALPGMQAARYGRIVNIASEAGRVGSKGSAVYSAAKGGVIAFTKVIARENARYGITANSIAPGPDRHAAAPARAPARRDRRQDHRDDGRDDADAPPRPARGGRLRGRLPRGGGELLRDRRDARRLRRPGDGLSERPRRCDGPPAA